MNQQQRKYAIQRINDIAIKAIADYSTANTAAEVRMTEEARFKAFKAGRYTVRKGVTKIGPFTDLCRVVDFTDEKPRTADVKKISAFVHKINERKAAVIDEIMLGDAAEAFKLIEAFTKFAG